MGFRIDANRFRIVSTFAGTERVLRWKIQKLADDNSESRWRDAVFAGGINFFTTSEEAVKKMYELAEVK